VQGSVGAGAVTVAICDYCGRLRELDGQGRIVRHRVSIPVSRAAIHSVGRAKVRPVCSGSGKAPRRIEP
jgi:hypothetical protein